MNDKLKKAMTILSICALLAVVIGLILYKFSVFDGLYVVAAGGITIFLVIITCALSEKFS